MSATPAERLIAAADLLDAPPTDEVGRQLARVLRSAVAVDRANRMNCRRPDRVLKGLFHLADLLLAGAS